MGKNCDDYTWTGTFLKQLDLLNKPSSDSGSFPYIPLRTIPIIDSCISLVKKCTCGASSVGSTRHETWCDLYEETK